MPPVTPRIRCRPAKALALTPCHRQQVAIGVLRATLHDGLIGRRLVPVFCGLQAWKLNDHIPRADGLAIEDRHFTTPDNEASAKGQQGGGYLAAVSLVALGMVNTELSNDIASAHLPRGLALGEHVGPDVLGPLVSVSALELGGRRGQAPSAFYGLHGLGGCI